MNDQLHLGLREKQLGEGVVLLSMSTLTETVGKRIFFFLNIVFYLKKDYDHPGWFGEREEGNQHSNH